MALDVILPIHVQKYINKMAGTCSPESVKKDYTILSLIMQHTVDKGLCKVSPAGKSIRLPNKIEPQEKHTYTQKECGTAYSFAKFQPVDLAIMLMMERKLSAMPYSIKIH